MFQIVESSAKGKGNTSRGLVVSTYLARQSTRGIFLALAASQVNLYSMARFDSICSFEFIRCIKLASSCKLLWHLETIDGLSLGC